MDKVLSSQSRLPDFVCVGGAKCGTTSLYEYLRAHPDIFLPNQKELHYFSYPELAQRPEGPGMRSVLKGLIATEEAYRAHYKGVGPSQIAGDISPSYLNESQAPARIKALLGPVRIIIMLRNPVERVISQYMHLRRAAREPLPFVEALAAEPERIAQRWGDMWHYTSSAYAAERTRRYIEAFGSERVLIVLLDDLREEPEATLGQIWRFLGVPENFSIDTTREFNRSGLPRSNLVARLIDASPIANFAKAVLPRRLGALLKRKVQEFNTGGQETIDPELRSKLRGMYQSEVIALEDTIGRKTGW